MATKEIREFSLIGFSRKFSDENDCRERLFHMRWSNGFVCPRCGGTKYYAVSTRRTLECKECKHQTSLTAGTIMHKTRTDLLFWFWIIYLVCTDKRGVSASYISRHIGIGYKTAWLILHKIRKAMQDRDSMYKLRGIIEMDETFIGSPSEGNDKRGRGSEKAKVIISVSVKNESVYYANMNIIDSVNKENIKVVLNDNVEKNQIIKTDGWRAYKICKESGHTHFVSVISNTKEKAHNLFKWVHILAENVKAFIEGTYHGIGQKHLQSYLDEFCYRFNRRLFGDQMFDRLLKAAVLSEGITYPELKG